MEDNRICMFYVTERLKIIAKSNNPEGLAEDFLSEMYHNLGVNAYNNRAFRDAPYEGEE